MGISEQLKYHGFLRTKYIEAVVPEPPMPASALMEDCPTRAVAMRIYQIEAVFCASFSALRIAVSRYDVRVMYLPGLMPLL